MRRDVGVEIGLGAVDADLTQQTGIESYALISEAAANALRLSDLAYPLVAHSETYEHIGEVKMQVLDLHKVWEREQDRKRFVVSPEAAWIHLEWNAPYAPVALWEYTTNLKLELRAQEYDMVERTDALGGRMQPETTYHCAHGQAHFFTRILDWKPFDFYTVEQDSGLMGIMEATYSLEELDQNRTRLTVRMKGRIRWLPRFLHRPVLRYVLTKMFDYSSVLAKLRDLINEETAHPAAQESAPALSEPAS